MTRFLMPRQTCVFIMMHLTSQVFCQDRINVDVTRVTRAAFLNPGFSYENKIGKLQTIYLTAYLATSAYYYSSSSLGTDAKIYFDPALRVQYRYYYNAAARVRKGRQTERNSMNYIGPLFDVTFTKAAMNDHSYEEENRRPVSTIAFVWGIQRNYLKRFSLDLNLGLGYSFTKGTEVSFNGQTAHVSQSAVSTPGYLSLGFWLDKRKDSNDRL